MLPNPEERKILRQAAAKKRAEETKKQRKMALLIGGGVLALALLIALTAGIVSFVRKRASEKAKQKPNETTIHLVAGGDLDVTDNVISSGGPDYNYTEAFKDVAAILADGDLTMLNYEGVFCSEPYGGEGASAPDTLAKALHSAGVDALQLANSYSIHQGVSGLHSTIDSVRKAGLTPLGVYDNSEDKGYVIYNVQGIRVAVVAFTKGMEGSRIPDVSAGCVNLLYTDYDSGYQEVDTKGITKVLDAIEEEKPDITIAMLHWGSTNNDKISHTQNQIVSLMQEHGVDAIIGSHSHRVQEMKLDENGKFVAYSLGDFFGDGQDAGTEYSVLLDLEIVKNHDTGETRIKGYSFTPIFTVSEEGKPLRVVRIREAMTAYENGYIDRVTKQTYDAMAYALTRIESRTSGNG